MKRSFDLLFSSFALLLLILPIFIIAFLVKITSAGPIIHWSERIGRNNHPFMMPKFRSMHVGAPNKATHLLSNPGLYVTNFGRLIRLTSLDELPQLISVIKGDMSLVGPRPALISQNDLIELRIKSGVDNFLPGITGWAQINGRDKLSINEKVKLDKEYMVRQNIFFDIKILWLTILSIRNQDEVSH